MPDEPADLSGLIDGRQIDQESLFGLVASLANLLDRELVVETISTVLGVQPVNDGDCVYFDDLAIRFGRDGRVKSVFRTIDGSHLPTE
jgi:hypothetical protein